MRGLSRRLARPGCMPGPAMAQPPGCHGRAQSIAALYPEVPPASVPFAEDAFGDQFCLSDGRVWHLAAETGELAEIAPSVEQFFSDVLSDVAGILRYEPVQATALVGGQLEAGKLISVYPPFVMEAGEAGRSFRPVDALDNRVALAAVAAQIRGLPDGATVQLKVVP
jgi:hypothetical protein